MRLQIACVLFSLLPLCQATSSICPSAKSSLCKGCCATDYKYDVACGKISDETECGKQIVCHWSDGPVSGAIYNVYDDFLNIDVDFISCYQSSNISALTAYMATLQDDPNNSRYHHKGSPLSGTCGDCYKDYNHQRKKWPYSNMVALGVWQYKDSRMDLKKISELQGSGSNTVYLIRHGEKDSKGCESATGLKRADNMYDVFKAKFNLPSYVFAFKYSGSECQRCKQTVDPIAKKLGVSVDFTQGSHTCGRGWGECKTFAAAVKKEMSTGPVLVAAEHGHIQYLANDLGVSKDDIPYWKGSDYDSVYVVTISGGRATLEHKYQTKKGLVEVVV
jgi:hypothetical protein